MSFVDSISIKFLSPSLIIYGKGNKLILHDITSKKNEELKPTRDKIHRISFLKCDNNSYRIACSAGREIFVTIVTNNSFQRDFKMKVKLSDWIMSLKYLENGNIAIVTAHNIALLLEINENQLTIKQKLKCDNNSTLYCSIIHGNGSGLEDLTFFSGTALGELIIWRVSEKEEMKSERAVTLYQKSLHNGVIFSIDYHEKCLVTSSDDRSIKIFKCSDDFSNVVELKQLFGHTSRVFVSRIIRYENKIKFLSSGEDSNLCIWNEDGTLDVKKNINASGGIWNLDYDENNSVIITSSSTGKLNKFLLKKIFFEHHKTEKFDTCVVPAKLIYLKNSTLCVLSNNMEIHTKSLSSEWMKVEKPENKCKIVAIDSFENRLFLAAKNSILIFDYCDNSKKLNFTSELNIDENFTLPSNKLDYYFRAIHALNRCEVFISEMHGCCFVIDVEMKIIKNLFQIPKPNMEPWTTAVAKYNDHYWIIADRVGSLYLYRNDTNLNAFHLPIQKISKLHGQLGITTIRITDDGFIKTSSVGGVIKTLFLNTKLDAIEMYQSERTAVNFIEKIRQYNGCEYIHGFNDDYFVIYKNHEIIYEHKCGGRHRHWDITLINGSSNKDNDDDENDDCKLRFAYINKKQVHFVEFYINDFIFNTDVDAFWHTKECNVIRMIDDVKILISGGEDTVLKLTKIEMIENDVSFRNIADVNSHISSIKAMATWKEGGGDDLFIFSVGGRAQIVLTRVIKMKYVKEEINFMLTDSLLLGNSKENTFDPETRFTCAHFNQKVNVLFVGCSDGYIRAFKLIRNEFSSTASLKLIIECFYGRSILEVTMIRNFLVSMATDGVVCFWYFDEQQESIRVVEKLYHNQNGINSFDVIPIDENKYRFATAGDDNDIYVSEFNIVKDSVKWHKTIKSCGVHIAQVTGLKFLSNDKLLSASIDQTVCKLKIIDDKFEIVDKRYTCISDVKGFAIFDNKYIFIYGAGLEAIEYF